MPNARYQIRIWISKSRLPELSRKAPQIYACTLDAWARLDVGGHDGLLRRVPRPREADVELPEQELHAERGDPTTGWQLPVASRTMQIVLRMARSGNRVHYDTSSNTSS